MSAASNRFTWFDLITNDVAGAKSFYGAVLGWKTRAWSEGGYEMWTVGEEMIGGVMKPPGKEAGSPPSWMGYVDVDDVDATAARARELGGKLVVPGTDIPGIGRYAVLADPQGAVFAIASTKEPGPAAREGRSPGHFSWADLNTTDSRAAWTFYESLFGWKKTGSMDMGPERGAYLMIGADPQQAMGGMSDMAVAMKTPPHWLYYVTVPDVDAAARKATEQGGQVVNGPVDIPGGRIAWCIDPQGARFAMFAAT